MTNAARMTVMIGNLRQAADLTDELAAGIRGLAEYGQSQLSQNCNSQLVNAFEKRLDGLARQLEHILPLLASPADHRSAPTNPSGGSA